MSSVLALCLFVILCRGSSQLGAEARLPHEIDLNGRSFTLSADVLVTYRGLMSDHYLTEEFHSAWQMRSRVDFTSHGYLSNYLSKRGTIHSVERQLFLVDRSASPAACRRVDIEAVDHALNVQFVELHETKHHVGTTRLLLFIQENSDKFRAIVTESRTFEQDILSKSRWEATLDGELTISVLYEESSALSLPLGVPSRVLVAKGHEFTMLLKFKRVVPLGENEPIYSGSSAPSLRHAHLTAGGPADRDKVGASGDLLFDMLAVERAVGCSIDSATSKDFLGELADTMRYRFSFSARLESESLDGHYKLAVGYEPELQTLRVDRQAGSRDSRTLVSYRHDRIYHAYQRRNGERDYFLDVILSVTQDDQLDNDVLCVVMKAGVGKRLADACENPLSLGEMLLGATEVTYLGLARVRGIEAYAFEASASRLPVWLEQPSVYRAGDASEDFALRRGTFAAAGQDQSQDQAYTTVFYFARPESTRGPSMIKDNKLLLMEIFRKNAISGQLAESYSVTIFDFTWQIKALAPNGQRTEDFYSLGDECPAAATRENHYARINLQLKGATSGANETNGQAKAVDLVEVADEWLQSPVVRNLAIMRAFSEQFGVPPTLVYDVETRYATGGGRERTVAVTMLAAERPEAPVELVYLGRGALRMDMRAHEISFMAFSFEVCYLVAAHSRKNTVLAWDERTSMCYMFHRERPDSRPEAVLEMNKRAAMEVYRVVPRADRKLVHDDYITKLDELHERLVSAGRLLLADPAGEVNGHNQESRKQAYFGIGELEVRHLNERTAYDLGEGKHLSNINKFLGLGLVSSDTQRNKVVEPKQVVRPDGTSGEPRDATMTFERCQAACLIDLECRSFSTCIVEGRLQCVLSTVDFRASTLVLQLMFLQANSSSKLGTVSPVKLDEQALATTPTGTPELGAVVHVRKHPTCELHNKLYTDLFSDGGSYNVNLQDRLLSPVTHPEQCAQKCYETSLASMREELARFNAPKERPEDWARWYAHTHCAGYFYLPHELAARNQLEITPEQLDGKNVDGATRGYCLLERGLGQFQMARTPAGGDDGGKRKKKKKTDASLKSQVVELRQSNLDFGVFYEKTHGVSLAETPKTQDEARAYSQVNYMRKLEPEWLEVMSAFMGRGGNTGSSSVTQNAATCARHCFTQLTPLWPACRSFEYIEVVDKTNARKNAFCAFNTATLWEARVPGRPQSLVLDKSEDQRRVRGFPNDDIQVWHYEPRDMLVAGHLAEAFQVRLGERSGSPASSMLHLSSVGLFCVICIVLVAGLLIAELLSRAHLFDAPGRGSRGDKEILVESATHIRIDNIVRPDGDREEAENGRV